MEKTKNLEEGPKRASSNVKRIIWSLLYLKIITVITYLFFLDYLISGFKQIISLKSMPTIKEELSLLWIPILSYVILTSLACLIVRVIKELKLFEEEGLVTRLVVGFVIGVLIGSFIGGFVGAFIGLLKGLFIGFILSLVTSITLCLFLCFIVSLFIGLYYEYRPKYVDT